MIVVPEKCLGQLLELAVDKQHLNCEFESASNDCFDLSLNQDERPLLLIATAAKAEEERPRS